MKVNDLECETCPENYINVSNHCLECGSEELLKKTYDETLCPSCGPNCLHCELGNICSICGVGYFVNDIKQCEACSENCSRCLSNQICLQCESEAVLSLDSSKCYQVGASILAIHKNSGLLSGEDTKFVLIYDSAKGDQNRDDKNSIPIVSNFEVLQFRETIENCLFYQLANFCLFCRPKHFAYQGMCLPCLENCQFCKSGDSCVECLGGYEFDAVDGKCLQKVTSIFSYKLFSDNYLI